MKLRYEVTTDDVVALSLHQARQALTRRTFLILGGLLGLSCLPAFLIVGFGLFAFAEDTSRTDILLVVLLFSGLIAATAILIWQLPRIMRRTATRQVRWWYEKRRMTGLLGPQELELTETELIRRSEFIKSRLRFSALVEVASGGGHTFLITNMVLAHIIPHAAVTEGDPEAFADAVRRKLADNPPAAG